MDKDKLSEYFDHIFDKEISEDNINKCDSCAAKVTCNGNCKETRK